MRNMPQAQWIVCEKSGQWAVALRRAAPGLPLVETRSLEECRQVIEQAPASLAAIETSLKNLEAVLAWMVELERFADARFCILGGRELAPYEWLLREAGALHVAYARRLAAPVARLARRRLEMFPPSPRSPLEEIYARLPLGLTPP